MLLVLRKEWWWASRCDTFSDENHKPLAKSTGEYHNGEIRQGTSLGEPCGEIETKKSSVNGHVGVQEQVFHAIKDFSGLGSGPLITNQRKNNCCWNCQGQTLVANYWQEVCSRLFLHLQRKCIWSTNLSLRHYPSRVSLEFPAIPLDEWAVDRWENSRCE